MGNTTERAGGESMENELMTLKDIAQRLELPESTLRKYRDAYPQFIPYVGSGRERRYREDAVEVFRAIRDCRVEKHLSWEDTERDLLDHFPVNSEALGGKVVVTEDEGNIFLERLEKAVRQLSSQGERQEFVTSTLASELLQMKKALEKLDPIAEDLQVVRRTSYGYNEVVQRQYKESQKYLMKIMELLSMVQGALQYIPRDLEKMMSATPKVEPRVAAPVAAPSAIESQTVTHLREELKLKTAEADKFRDLYVRAKREIDRLREELKKKTIEELYGARKGGAAEASAQVPAGEQEVSKGGKLFFRGKKKSEDRK